MPFGTVGALYDRPLEFGQLQSRINVAYVQEMPRRRRFLTEPRSGGTPLATGVSPWMERLRRERCVRVTLVVQDARRRHDKTSVAASPLCKEAPSARIFLFATVQT